MNTGDLMQDLNELVNSWNVWHKKVEEYLNDNSKLLSLKNDTTLKEDCSGIYSSLSKISKLVDKVCNKFIIIMLVFGKKF